MCSITIKYIPSAFVYKSKLTSDHFLIFMFYLNVVIEVETIDKDKMIDTKY